MILAKRLKASLQATGAVPTPTVTKGAVSEDGTNQPTYSFASVSTPDAATGRYVVPFCLYDAGSANLRTISDITYDTVSQTVYGPASGIYCPIAAAVIQDSTGTTAAVSFTGSSTGGTNGTVNAFSVNGVNALTYHDVDAVGSNSATSLTATVDIPANSLVLVYAHSNLSATTTATFSGDVSLTKFTEEGFQSTGIVVCAYGFFSSNQGTCNITCTFSGTADRCSMTALVLTVS